MREILFKAKTKRIVREYNCGIDDGEWVKGYLRQDCGMWLIYQFEYDRADQMAYEIDPDTICQYTGLTDIDGNKIWENDIFAYGEEMGVIRFGENGDHKFDYGFYVDFGDSYLRNDLGFWLKERTIKVIGNIFDNPELL